MKDIPAFVDEDFMTARDNYLSRIDYELKKIQRFDGSIDNITKTWKSVDKELKTDKNIGSQLTKGNLVKNLIPESIKTIDSNLDKAKAIFEYVQSNYTWNGDFDIFKDVSVKELIKTKTGNVSEINFLLYNLLKENDINVKPVLLSTRKNGFPTKIYPVISDFNYVINQVDIEGKKYLLDATDNYLEFGQIPYRCLNGEGRLLDFKNGSNWIPIKPSKLSLLSHSVNLNLNKDLSITGTIKSKTGGYDALKLKQNYFRNNESHLGEIKNKYPDLNLSNYDTNLKNKTDYNFTENYDVRLVPEQIGNNIYIDPFLIKFFTENPFKLQERTYPIDFGYSRVLLYNFQLKINDDYKIEQLPEKIAIQLPNATGRITLNLIEKESTILMSFKISLKTSMYNVNYYPYLKELFGKIVDTQNNSMIVLAKK